MKLRLNEPPSSELTPEQSYHSRREWLKRAGLFAGASALWGGGLIALLSRGAAERPPVPVADENDPLRALPRRLPKEAYAITEAETPFEDATTYNNYYELGLRKSDPARHADKLRPRPWTLEVGGEIKEPRRIDLDELLSWFTLEDRVYRMRCVEAWSMVIPWLGFPLAELIARLEPTSRAKYVEFTTLLDPEQLPGQNDDVLPWPYVEGLRIDEAMNPLTLLAVGLYGRSLPGQNGAPLRLVVPWKYGFKGIKSIVRLRLVEREPRTAWHAVAPGEYGFYANVNPEVDHPRWSQATERRINETGRRPTLLFNGYADHVASLYSGLDLKRYF